MQEVNLNKSLGRLRHLADHLLRTSSLSSLDGVAVIGECEVPCAHIIYYYHENDYMLAIKATKDKCYTTKLISAHSDEQREYTVNLWLPELLLQEKS
jgi:hypothetical protein